MFNFYKNKKIFITGHTGFKGTWLTKMLTLAGAEITGYSLEPPTNPSLYKLCQIEKNMNSVYGDIRDVTLLKKVFSQAKPEIVFHLAAQPIVLESYNNPHYTYETNVMGTVNILECIRENESVKSFLNVTTDKVYKNREWVWGYREDDPLDGFDPYSNSKSCSELITHSYNNSFFRDRDVSLSTARAGNVIGGGDFANDRIIPDCFRAVSSGKEIIIRNPHSIRPYQHVLEPLYVYLMIAMKQYEDKEYSGYYNVGPNDEDCITTGQLVDLFCKGWMKATGNTVTWASQYIGGPHEAKFLKLDCSKLRSIYQWNPLWNIENAIGKTVEWMKVYFDGNDINSVMEKQITDFIGGR